MAHQGAEARAQQRAEALLEECEHEVREARDSVLRELTEVRDGLHELASEGQLARISAGEYADRLNRLRARQRQAEGSLAEVEEAIEHIATVEDDPVAWADDLASRFPKLREEFPW